MDHINKANLRVIICLSLSSMLAIMLFACADSRRTKYCIGAIRTDELVQLMQNKSWTTQHLVARVAVERGIAALPSLLNMVNCGDKSVQQSVWSAVATLEGPDSAQLLIEFLEGRGWTDRGGIEILRLVGGQGVEPLRRALRQTSGGARRAAIRALGEISDPRAGQVLQEIVPNKTDPHWGLVISVLAGRRDEAGHAVLKLAESDPDVWKIVSRHLKPADGKWLLPLYFRQAKSEDESIRYRGLMGIARNAGKAELTRIEAELKESDRAWVRPFVEISCAIEGVESESEKAEVLWEFILDAEYYSSSNSEGRSYGVYGEASRYIGQMGVPQDGLPVIYAIERLAELGDVTLPLLREGLRSSRKEVRLRAIRALTEMPPSRASTELLLKAWDSLKWEDDSEPELRILDRIAGELGDRDERRAIPRIFEVLDEASLYFFPRNALEALGKLGDRTAIPRIMNVWGEMMPRMMELYGDVGGSEKARIRIAGGLAEAINHRKITDPSVIPLLIDAMLSHVHGDGPYGGLYTHRLAAILALVRIGKPAIKSLRELTELEGTLEGRRPNAPLNIELAKTALSILGQPVTPGSES